MSRKIVVAISVLEDKHRAQIRAAAEARGFDIAFFNSDKEAEPHLTDAEIVFGQSALLAKKSPRLRWLCTPSAGVNQFLAPGTFASPDAMLSNSSGAYGVTISEHICMVALSMLRRQLEYNALISRHGWRRDLKIRSIHGSRITMLGTGDIGCAAVSRLRAFNPASIWGVNRSGRNPGGCFDRVFRQEQLADVLAETDILVVSLPGTAETTHMLDADMFSRLPDGALVVNVGRGTVIDQKALEAELRAGRLSAALDVFEEEPLPPDDSLWDCPNLMITSHTAGNMTLPYTRDRIVSMFLEDFENYCEGRPLMRRVDLAKGY